MEQEQKDILKNEREKIDGIDSQIISLFEERMRTAAKIAGYKKQNGKAVFDPIRERQKMTDIIKRSSDEMLPYSPILFSTLFELSRAYQNRLIGEKSDLNEEIQNAIENTPKVFPEFASVACQGIEGSNSQAACNRLFKNADIMFFKNFDAVFTAIEKGLCKYGVIPIENSTAGSVNAVYDLMMDHKFYIVRSIRVKVDHHLLAKKGAKLSDIKEIYSHEQAISQCSHFLSKHPEIKVISCSNTAVASKIVMESDRNDIAALSSRECMKYYGLDCIESSVQNSDGNYTRFICIAKDLEIYPGADRTSLMITLPHEPGTLYRILSKFNALSVNLNKLESRPLPKGEFEFMFYFDIETPVYSDKFVQLISELPSSCERFMYLGSYSEVI
ncbi:MAG: chorismate mutase [Clostridia bacterium]|nr:chorismate mutase [Clostridia bacterium]